MTYLFAGWRPSIGLDRKSLGGLWWFALPFQMTWITYIFRDSLIPIVGGLLLNTMQVGYLNWAFALAGVPGQMAQIVGRVSFPSFSRLQDDPARMARAIESSLRALFLIAIPAHLAMIATGRWLIDIVFTDKWLPALIPLYFLSVYWAGTSITSPFVSALNALGRVRSTLVLNILWTIAQVGLSLLFLAWYGFAGVALAFAVVRIFAIVAVIVMLVRIVPVRLGPATVSPLIASVVMAVAGYAATQLLPERLVTLVLVGAGMVALYAAVLWVLEQNRLREDIAHLRALLK
jgi:PST family polysaccharide transporter